MQKPLPSERLAYKILTSEEWHAAQSEGQGWSGTALDARDGFIHLSYAHQVPGVIQRYFMDAEGLWLIVLDTALLAEDLHEEPSTGGEIFPHLYSGWKPDAVVKAAPLMRNAAAE